MICFDVPSGSEVRWYGVTPSFGLKCRVVQWRREVGWYEMSCRRVVT